MTAIRRFMNDQKRHFHDRILLAAGARSQESRRRMGTAEVMRQENVRIWVNPLIDWSKADILDYMEIHALPHNQVVDILHMSGECLCGCFAQEDELPTLEIWFPETAASIHWLEARVKERGFPWGWGQSPPESWRALQRGQLLLPGVDPVFLPLCTSCNARFARKPQPNEGVRTTTPSSSHMWTIPTPVPLATKPSVLQVPVAPTILRPDDWPVPLREEERHLLQSLCEEQDVPFALITALLQLEQQMGAKSNRAGIQTSIQEVFSRDWSRGAHAGEPEHPKQAQAKNAPGLLVPASCQQLSLW